MKYYIKFTWDRLKGKIYTPYGEVNGIYTLEEMKNLIKKWIIEEDLKKEEQREIEAR